MRTITGALGVQALLLAMACGPIGPIGIERPKDTFMNNVTALCGKAFEGRVTVNEPAAPDDPFVGPRLVMHVQSCEGTEIRIPFHVGEDRLEGSDDSRSGGSRSWGLRFMERAGASRHHLVIDS